MFLFCLFCILDSELSPSFISNRGQYWHCFDGSFNLSCSNIFQIKWKWWEVLGECSCPSHHPSQGAPAVTLFTGALSLQCPPPLSLQSNHPNLHVRPMYISTPPCEPLQNHANVSKHARPCVKHNRNTVKGSAGMHYKQCRFPCATQPPLPPHAGSRSHADRLRQILYW